MMLCRSLPEKILEAARHKAHSSQNTFAPMLIKADLSESSNEKRKGTGS